MMRRGRNQAYACRRTAAFGNPGINLAARQLSAFTRLSALCNFNLDFVRIDKVIAGYAKTAAGNLLNCTALAVTIRQRCKTVGILAPSPVLLLPPIRFMAIARHSCAS